MLYRDGILVLSENSLNQILDPSVFPFSFFLLPIFLSKSFRVFIFVPPAMEPSFSYLNLSLSLLNLLLTLTLMKTLKLSRHMYINAKRRDLTAKHIMYLKQTSLSQTNYIVGFCASALFETRVCNIRIIIIRRIVYTSIWVYNKSNNCILSYVYSLTYHATFKCNIRIVALAFHIMTFPTVFSLRFL